jgi:hypothetical protein
VVKYSWAHNSLGTDIKDLDDDISSIAELQEQLIKIQNDETTIL